MGAHDWIDEEATCPACDKAHRCQLQNDFRFADYHEMTTLRPGEWHPIPGDVDELLGDINDAGYVRLRELGPGPFVVATSEIYHRICDCNAWLVVAPVFEVSGDRVRLAEVRLLDARQDLDADYASAETFLLPEGTRHAEKHLRTLSLEERRQSLAAFHQRFFAG